MDIPGKTAVVTGGASGLGLATVKRLVDAGAAVAVFDLNEIQDGALTGNDRILYRRVDVADEGAVRAAMDATVAKFGGIHICCNFAGIAVAAKTMGRSGPHPLDLYNKVLQINLAGTFNVLRLAAEQMAANEPVDEHGGRGVIVNTASVAAFEGQIGQAAYSASKGGITGMTVPVARDLAGLGIRVNTIAPGLIHTPCSTTWRKRRASPWRNPCFIQSAWAVPTRLPALPVHYRKRLHQRGDHPDRRRHQDAAALIRIRTRTRTGTEFNSVPFRMPMLDRINASFDTI